MSLDSKIVQPCPACGQKLRWPTDLGPLIVTCPPCRNKWDWQCKEQLSIVDNGEDSESAELLIAPVVEFENTKDFFEQLSKDIEKGKPLTVETIFEKESEFPEELKKFIKAEEKSGPLAVRSLAGKPILVMTSASAVGASLGVGVVVVFGSSLAIVGAGIGAVIGLIVGAVSTSISSGSHRIEIVFDVHGKIMIRFNPVSTESSKEKSEQAA